MPADSPNRASKKRWKSSRVRAAGSLILLGFAACAPAPTVARETIPAFDATCAADFDSVETVVRADYAGYADKVRGREAALALLTDSVRGATRSPLDASTCARAMARWVAFFRDAHLAVGSVSVTPSPAAPLPNRLQRGDGGRPTLVFEDDSTAVLRLPNFAVRYAPAIDSLVSGNFDRLAATPYLVIDVRSNGGGWPGSYASIIPLLYTDPIRVDGIDTWSTPGNIESMRAGLRDGVLEEVQALIRAVLPRMEAGLGGFVVLEADREIRLDTVLPLPRSVAVLIGRGCASSCEQFVLEAMQSRKVTLMGSAHTLGAVDYLNVRTVDLPSRRRQLRVPIARSRRLPDRPLDGVGIAPEVALPPRAGAAIDFARQYLRSLPPP